MSLKDDAEHYDVQTDGGPAAVTPDDPRPLCPLCSQKCGADLITPIDTAYCEITDIVAGIRDAEILHISLIVPRRLSLPCSVQVNVPNLTVERACEIIRSLHGTDAKASGQLVDVRVGKHALILGSLHRETPCPVTDSVQAALDEACGE